MFAPKPHKIFEHPTLGSFRFEDDVWIADILQGASTLALSLAGNDTAPDDGLVAAASVLLARFSEVKEEALAFLLSQEDAPNREDFICNGMELVREDCPSHFSLSFILFEDEGGLWRVECENGEPLFLARDD